MKCIASLILVITCMSSCAKKSEILHGTLCVKCEHDLPSWRNGYCPKCHYMPPAVADNLVKWNTMEGNLARLTRENKLRKQP